MQPNGFEASTSNGSASAPSDQLLSHDARWKQHRASQEINPSTLPSALSTPAATPLPLRDDFGDAPAPRSRSISHETEAEAGPSTASRTSQSGVDAEDEDVKIAIMALGAMKSLDGRANALNQCADTSGWSSGSQASGAYGRLPPGIKSPHPMSSALSASSVTSTALSSPSSTPATDLTHESGAESPNGVSSRNRRGPATLADLPPDFQFPALIRDEQGNEVRVDPEMMNDAAFLSRVSHLPIVRGTLRAYELGKQHSKVVKYGADLVESSVKSISRPVVSRLGASLGERGVEQLDDFACRQLDRIYPAPSPTKEEKKGLIAEEDENENHAWQHMGDEEREKRRTAYLALKMEEREREMMVAELRQLKDMGRDASSERDGAGPSYEGACAADREGFNSQDHDRDRAAAAQALVRSQGGLPFKGSRWGSMLVGAGAAAGGLSAAMSEESMKSLKYCLQWLQYATAHIEHQITVLRDLIVKLNHGELDVTGSAVQNLGNIKGDVVNTIRGVVDVVGKYAGSALPEPARNSVKAFILSLPARWATVNRSPAASSPRGYFGGSPSSSSFSPAHISSGPDSPAQFSAQRPIRGGGTPRDQIQAAATAQAANKILTLAVESLDILRSVTIVFGESLDRADLWVERLRILGLQRKRQHEQAAEESGHRIAAGPSAPGATAPWESARVYSRASSPGGDSDASMGTSASAKRRRVKNPRAGHNHSPGPSSFISHTPSVLSDDENLTETERGAIHSGSRSTGAVPTLYANHGTATSSSLLNSGSGSGNGSNGHPIRRRARAGTGSKLYHGYGHSQNMPPPSNLPRSSSASAPSGDRMDAD
ncbi:transcriptional regulator opi1 [Thecaphora frezii]